MQKCTRINAKFLLGQDRTSLWLVIMLVSCGAQITKRIEGENDDIRVANEAKLFESAVGFKTDIKGRMLNPTKVSYQKYAQILLTEMTLDSESIAGLRILREIAAITGLYKGLDRAMADVRSVKANLGEARCGWSRKSAE